MLGTQKSSPQPPDDDPAVTENILQPSIERATENVIQQADDRALELERRLAQSPPPDDDRVTENTQRPEPAAYDIDSVINTPTSLSDLDKYNYFTKQEGLFQPKGTYVLNYQLK